ncbi:hypothetical protein BGZ92_006271 [Podila epicladia]|nr:hypothetical protein BGZ92_006271 [Podila epicladia]
MRPIISLPVQASGAITTISTRKPLNILFLYLELSPQTYFFAEAKRALVLDDMFVVRESVTTNIAGSSIQLPLFLNKFKVAVMQSPAKSRFVHLNISGNDFVRAAGTQVQFGGDSEAPQFEIYFP